MTLAEILKPSLTVISHAELKGLQLGAGIATISAVPCVIFRPSLINTQNDPPLVAIANIAGIGAVLGAGTVTLACAYKLSKIGKDGIIQRAEKLAQNKEEKNLTIASALGAAVGVTLVATRIWGMAKDQGKCVFGLTFRKQTAWEVFAFGVMGISVGAGVYKIGKLVCDKLDNGKIREVCQLDEGDAVDTSAVKDVADAVVEDVEKVVEETVEAVKKDE